MCASCLRRGRFKRWKHLCKIPAIRHRPSHKSGGLCLSAFQAISERIVHLFHVCMQLCDVFGQKTFISRSLGLGDTDKARKTSAFCIWTSAAAGIGIARKIDMLAFAIAILV